MDTQKSKDNAREAFFKADELDDLLALPVYFMLFEDDNGRWWFVPKFVQISKKEH